MKLKIILAVLIVLAVIGSLAGIKVLQIRKLIAAGKAFKMPPETVTSAVARAERWQDTLTAIGSITAVQGVTLTPDIPGVVRVIAFESGAVVAAGDLLVRLDTSVEEAQLKALEAQATLAALNLERVRKLRTDGTVSQAELDTAEAASKEVQANADALRATIAKKAVRAPFAGQLGIRQVNLGQYLDMGKPVVTLQALNPVYADFSLPQQAMARLKPGMRIRLTSDTYPGRTFEGVLTTIAPELDRETRSVGLQGTLENPDQVLRPGMFTRVEVLLPEEQSVLVIPATSIQSAPYGDSVYIIEPGKAENGEKPPLVVRQQFVRIGKARGDFISVESGLKAGDRVASAGLFKLRNGMTVVENNELTPSSTENPQPADN